MSTTGKMGEGNSPHLCFSFTLREEICKGKCIDTASIASGTEEETIVAVLPGLTFLS